MTSVDAAAAGIRRIAADSAVVHRQGAAIVDAAPVVRRVVADGAVVQDQIAVIGVLDRMS